MGEDPATLRKEHLNFSWASLHFNDASTEDFMVYSVTRIKALFDIVVTNGAVGIGFNERGLRIWNAGRLGGRRAWLAAADTLSRTVGRSMAVQVATKFALHLYNLGADHCDNDMPLFAAFAADRSNVLGNLRHVFSLPE